MFISARDPIGRLTSLDLEACPVWRLGLRTCPWPSDEPGKPHHALGLTVDYVAGGVVSWMILAAVDFKLVAEPVEVAKVGFPHNDRVRDRERFQEALRILVNSSLGSKEIEAITADACGLVELYHDIAEYLWRPSVPLGEVEQTSLFRTHGAWMLAITPDRSTPWLHTQDRDQAPPTDGSSIGPGTPAKSAPKPKTPSRESRRAAATAGAAPASPTTTAPDVTPLGGHGKQDQANGGEEVF